MTVLVSSTASARSEAHDARQEQVLRHRTEALARAKELSNSKNGYTSATYTGSGFSTPRSGYSRTRKAAGSITGSISDCDRLSGSDVGGSRTNLSNRSSNVRKSQVSFRNEEYNRLALSNRKRRRSYSHRSKTPAGIIKSNQSINGNNSESSGTNSINKQADTGYDGSVSSGPSVSTPIKDNKSKEVDYTEGLKIIQTVSNDSNVGRLSIVPSLDESVNDENPIPPSNDNDHNPKSSNETEVISDHKPETETQANVIDTSAPGNGTVPSNDNLVELKTDSKVIEVGSRETSISLEKHSTDSNLVTGLGSATNGPTSIE